MSEVFPPWPDGWHPVSSQKSAALTRQLRQELGRPDPLQGLTWRCIGTFGGSDDVLCAIDGWDAPYFVAHLTWATDSRPFWRRLFERRPDTHALYLYPVHTQADLIGYFG